MNYGLALSPQINWEKILFYLKDFLHSGSADILVADISTFAEICFIK